VLVVDDDADARAMITLALSLEGYRTATASNGAEALDVAREVRPCLVLLDLMMPVMDGSQFRKQQCQDPSIARIPVICVSAAHDAPSTARAMGASGCLAKPVDLDRLVDEVRAVCGPA
jgi:CheY-like chemotaxis protein